MSTVIANVTRGELVESRHHGVIVVATVDGTIVLSAGDPELLAYFRSSAKPFQAVPLIESGAADRFGFTDAEIALCCSSHDGAPWQQALVRGMLEKIGLPITALHCGVAPPYDEEEAARVRAGLVEGTPLHCDCSGKHAGMLAWCVHTGAPTENYLDASHPLQREILRVTAPALGVEQDSVRLAADGCSVPTFGAPIAAFARAYAALAAPGAHPDPAVREHETALVRARNAMASHPKHIAGPGNLDTDIIEVTGGRLIAKLGAEGLVCIAVPDRQMGVAVSMLDGSERARATVALAVLDQLGLFSAEERTELQRRQDPAVTNFNGWHVGDIVPVFSLAEAV
ncbi:MAG TPA: asparaginase [Thermomicrobiales bacterium]|jgi:L-asparaginase II|nr:asparaginase [Thermomicrobiales bacterium]